MSEEIETEEEIQFTDESGETEIISKTSNLSGYIPGQVAEALDVFLGGSERYTCYVYKKTKEGQELCGKYENSIPEPDEIGNIHGGGKFHYVFKIPPKGNKGRPAMKDAWISLSEAFDEIAAIGRRKRMIEIPQSNQQTQNVGFGGVSRVLEIALGAALAPKTENGQNMEMFRIMMESQEKATLRMEAMIERSERNTRELITSIVGQKSNLDETLATVLKLKEIGGIFGGGDSKSTLSEVLEFAQPLALAAFDKLGAAKPSTPPPTGQIAHEEEEMDLDAIVGEIVGRIDELLTAATSGPSIKRRIVISQMKKAPEFSALLASPPHLAKVREGIGEEKYVKLCEVFGIK